MEVHTRTAAVKTIDELGNDRVRMTLRDASQVPTATGPAAMPVGGGGLYTIDCDQADPPFKPGEQMTITVSRGA